MVVWERPTAKAMVVETEATGWQSRVAVVGVLLCLLSLAAAEGVAREAEGRRRVIEQTEWQALVAIKQALRDERGALRSWNTSGGGGGEAGVCSGQWAGVKCANGRVISLQLANKRLSGQLAAEVGQLVELRKLNFHSNAISGPIPASISALPNVRGIYLFHNLLSGSIPDPLSSSPALRFLDLSSNNLSGTIPTNLSSSSRLRRLDLSSNRLSGPMPASLTSFPRLQYLRLSHNELSGHLPLQLSQLSLLQNIDLSDNLLNGSLPALHNLSSLVSLNVSDNELTGVIPAQLGNITGLSSLDLSRNNFTGHLPSSLAKLTDLTTFNCSYNNLQGAIPSLVHTFNASSFEGNINLCGYSPSVPCAPPSPAPTSVHKPEVQQTSSAEKKKRFSALSLVFIIIGSAIVAFLLLCLFSLLFLCCCRKTEVGKAGFPGEKSGQSSVKEAAETGGKLVHFEGSLQFAADDLLCATAEVLGKSTYGTVYKATLEDGNQMAVKRLREGIVKSQRDFETEVATLGGIRHPNLLALRAFYWGPKDEKLLTYDFMLGGSLAAFLHARGPETPLTWQTRMNIAIGAARGLSYLHDHEKIVHGNLTSSNILLDSHMSPRLSDFGLSRLMTTAANSNVIATAGALGYRAPELTKLKHATSKSDVYSFGIVLLELLTGKAPSEGSSTESGMDLPEWVASIVKEEWTHELFDLELMKGRAPGDDELINTLQVAMACVRTPPHERPEMGEVVQQLEQIKPDLKQ